MELISAQTPDPRPTLSYAEAVQRLGSAVAPSSAASAVHVSATLNRSITDALTPIVREQSGEALAAVQPAAARWRRAVTKALAVVRFGPAASSSDGGGGGDGDDAGGGEGKEKKDAQRKGGGGGGGGGSDPAPSMTPAERKRAKKKAKAARQKASKERQELFESIPDEVWCIAFAYLNTMDPKTLLTTVPSVCKVWRGAVSGLRAHLDFRWCHTLGMQVPVEALVGCLTTPFVVNAANAGSSTTTTTTTTGTTGTTDTTPWTTGLCQLFPRATAVTLHGVSDGHVLAFAQQAHGSLTDVTFKGGEGARGGRPPSSSAAAAAAAPLTVETMVAFGKSNPDVTAIRIMLLETLADAAVIAFVNLRPKIKVANFAGCRLLTNESVLALAASCGETLTNANFAVCWSLTNDAVIALAEQCPVLQCVEFGSCYRLTDDALLALAANCGDNVVPLTSVGFEFCENLTDVGVIALAEKCGPHLVAVNFGQQGGEDITDAAVIALAENCSGSLTTVGFEYCERLTDRAVEAVRALNVACGGAITHCCFESCKKISPEARQAVNSRPLDAYIMA